MSGIGEEKSVAERIFEAVGVCSRVGFTLKQDRPGLWLAESVGGAIPSSFFAGSIVAALESLARHVELTEPKPEVDETPRGYEV